MEFGSEFEQVFTSRTLQIVEAYDKEYDATLLLNCLLGLLILPKEKFIEKIPQTSIEDLSDWGISTDTIKKFGTCQCGRENPRHLRQLTKSLRNAVAHFRVKPVNGEGKCIGFEFRDRSGFHAELSLEEMHTFVRKLASHLNTQSTS